jgi:hypothetical protein
MEVSMKDAVIRAALARAVDAIARLPDHQQELSNRQDMLALLRGEDTGRDGYLVAKALVYAVVDGLPVDPEMVRLLRAMARRYPGFLATITYSVKNHAGAAPDLGPKVNAIVDRMWRERVRHDAIEAAEATLH